MKAKETNPINVFVCNLDDFYSEIATIRSVYKTKIKFWLPQSALSDKRIAYWKDTERIDLRNTDNSLTYIQWDLKVNTCQHHIINDERRYLIDRQEQADFLMLDKRVYEKGIIILFKDAVHRKELPDKFVKICSFTKVDMLLQYCVKKNLFGFSIEDTSLFVKDAKLSASEGTYVAKEIKTGYYWYLDLLHKNHYEVFDSTGKKHIGEANMNGELIPESADKNKKLL